MKLTFEMHGYTIVIEETEENLIKLSKCKHLILKNDG